MADRDWTGEPAKDNTVAADKVLILDSEASDANKLVEIGNLNITTTQLSGRVTNNQLPFTIAQSEINANRFTFTALTSPFSATPVLNLAQNEMQIMPLTGDITAITTSNRGIGRKKMLILTADATNRTVTFNTDWKTYPEVLAFTVQANRRAILSLVCTGNAETDIIAGMAEFA